jgi:hypothetical protein
VALTEAGDRAVIRMLIGRHHPERHVLDTATLDPATRLLPDAVRIQPQGHHHRRGVRRRPPATEAIGLIERGQLELVNHVNNAPRQVILRQPLGHARRHQELLIAIHHTEVERHDDDHDDIQIRTRGPPTADPCNRLWHTRPVAAIRDHQPRLVA